MMSVSRLVIALACAGAIAIGQQSLLAGAKPKSGEKVGMKTKVPVVIQAYYPLNPQHKFIVDYLQKLAKSRPGKVRLEIYDTQTTEGRRAWMKTGLTCSGVFINGKTRWEIKRGGKTETVDFVKRMDVFWTRKDFETVVNQLLTQAAKSKKK